MNIEHFLDLFFHRNIFIIEVLFGVVLFGVIFLTIRSFLRAEGAGNEMNFSGLEEGLKKILENHAGNSSAHANDNASVEGDAIMEEMATQIERLKLQLMQKTEEVEQLKSGGAVAASATTATEAPVKAASSSFSGGTSTELEEKVRELEARLSEYSIIEDDIADLSFYKEETVRLQAEIDKLKAKLAEYEAGGPAPKFMAPPPPSAAPAPAPVAPTPTPIAAVPAPTPAVAAAPAATASSAPEVTDVFGSVDDDIMAEFERAVTEQKASSSAQKVATTLTSAPKAAAPPPAATPMAEASIPTAQEIADAAIAAAMAPQSVVAPTPAVVSQPTPPEVPIPTAQEIADAAIAAAMASQPATAPTSDLTTESRDLSQSESEEEVVSGINLDKMLSEVGGLPDDSNEDAVSNALEQELDTEKLLQEATGMEKSDTEADEDFSELIKKEGA